MVTSIVLNVIALLLWIVAIIAATGTGSNFTKGNEKESRFGMLVTVFLGGIAYILQVIA